MTGSVLTLISELLDGTDDDTEALYVQALAGEFAEAGLLQAMISNWDRIRAMGEGLGPVAVATLNVLSNMMEQDEQTSDFLVLGMHPLQLCCETINAKRGSKEPMDEVELLASEVLATALQGCTSAEELAESGAAVPAPDPKRDVALMESLLIIIHGKGRKVAESAADTEVVANSADAVATLLLKFKARFEPAFVQCEGIQLMCKLLESKGCGLVSAFRVLSFALNDQATCETFVDSGAIKQLFGWWKKSEWPKKMVSRHHWGPEEWRSMREHLVAILFCLCSNLEAGTVQQLRLWKKFADEPEAVAMCATAWSGARTHLLQKGLMPAFLEGADDHVNDDLDEAEEELLLQRVAEGIHALAQLTVIMLCLAALPSLLQPKLRAAVHQQAQRLGIKWRDVAAVIHDLKKRTGDDFVAALEDVKDVFP